MEAMLRSLSGKPSQRQALERYDIGSVRLKLETLALLAFEPKHFTTGRPVHMVDLLAKKRREPLGSAGQGALGRVA